MTNAIEIGFLTACLPIPAGVRVVLVYAINPHGFAWLRRVTEDNVDLNRNWNRNGRSPAPNAGYAELHPVRCPDGQEPP